MTTQLPLINPGDMRNQITINTQVMAATSFGPQATDSPFVTCRAEIRTMTGSEIYKAGQFVDRANILINIYYQPGVLAKMSVTDNNGNHYQINAVINERNQNRFLSLLCEQMNDQKV